MNTNSGDLNRLRLLIESINDGLRDVARLKDNERKRVIRCAFADVQRARQFWNDGRVEGMPEVMHPLIAATTKLVTASNTDGWMMRSTMVTEAHKCIVASLGALKNNLAQSQREVTHACA